MESSIKLRLRELIRVYEISQMALSQIVGVKQGYLNQVFMGKKRISSTIIFGIAENFPDVNLNWLLMGRGEMLLVSGDEKCTDHPPLELVVAEPSTPYLSIPQRLEQLEQRVTALEQKG